MDDPDVTRTSSKVEVRASWGTSSTPVYPATHFAVSVGFASADSQPDGVYLTVGHLAPPILLGEAESVQAALEGQVFQVDVLGRYLLTRSRLGQLIDVLRTVADQYDEVADKKEGQ